MANVQCQGIEHLSHYQTTKSTVLKLSLMCNCNSQALKTKKGGIVKKSIFATPEGPGGRVGVGTCGIAGRPMTDYVQQEKRKKK